MLISLYFISLVFYTVLMRFIYLAFLFGLVGCGPGFQVATFCNGTYNKQVILPLILTLDDSVDSTNMTALLNAGSTIEKQTGLNLFQYRRMTGFSGVRRDGINSVMAFGVWPLSSNIQGQTTMHWSGDWIVDSDIYVNFQHYVYFTGNKGVGVHLESLYVHELLHAIGLTHNENAGSVMNSSLGHNTVRTALSAEDVSAIQCLYQ